MIEKMNELFIKNSLPYLLGYGFFGIFTFLGLVPANIYPKVLEAIFVYMMFLIFLLVCFAGCFGECAGWSDPSQPRNLRRIKKSDLKKSRRALQGIEEETDDLEEGERGDFNRASSGNRDQFDQLLGSPPTSMLEYYLPCFKKSNRRVHPEQMTHKQRMSESQKKAFERCRELQVVPKRPTSIPRSSQRNSESVRGSEMGSMTGGNSRDNRYKSDCFGLFTSSSRVASTVRVRPIEEEDNDKVASSSPVIVVKSGEKIKEHIGNQNGKQTDFDNVSRDKNTTIIHTTSKDKVEAEEKKDQESVESQSETKVGGDNDGGETIAPESSNYNVTDFDQQHQ